MHIRFIISIINFIFQTSKSVEKEHFCCNQFDILTGPWIIYTIHGQYWRASKAGKIEHKVCSTIKYDYFGLTESVINRGASFRWTFSPNSARGSIESNFHETIRSPVLPPYSNWMYHNNLLLCLRVQPFWWSENLFWPKT